jgi:hypothetical protein
MTTAVGFAAEIMRLTFERRRVQRKYRLETSD